MNHSHSVILLDNEVKTKKLVSNLTNGTYPDFLWLKTKDIGEFSPYQIERFMEEEERHDRKVLTEGSGQSLKSMSSGERKKALLHYLMAQNPEVLIVVNAYDSLDKGSQEQLTRNFQDLSQKLSLIQITTRVSDAFPFVQQFFQFKDNLLLKFKKGEGFKSTSDRTKPRIGQKAPQPIKSIPLLDECLVEFKNVSVSFGTKPVLKEINWTIKSKEFWQLVGPNGSGKSTLLNLITGDSHKGYGQDLTLFGHKKGSGESVWDLKELIGYFSPAMVDRFRGYHTLEQMIVSGLYDSIGLYTKPSETEIHKAVEWLGLLGLENRKHCYFHELSIGAKRLVMTARALIKHPPLLILDEPTVGLDDAGATFFVELINTYAQGSDSAIIYVSHRNEPNLRPEKRFELQPSAAGSLGFINSS